MSAEIDQLFASANRERPVLSKAKPVYIYGAGNMGREVAGLLRGKNFQIAGFLDQKATSLGPWEKIPVYAPDSADISRAQRANSSVVIGVFNRDADILPIVELLKSLGYGDVITFVDFHAQFIADLGDRFWLTSPDFYSDKKKPMAEGLHLFSDEKSRELYLALLRFRLTGDHAALSAPTIDDQYFPDDLPKWAEPLRLIDCGAFDGDTLREVSRRGLNLEAIAAFEPDPNNFTKLAACANKFLSKSTTANLFPCGVSSIKQQIRFASGQGAASHAMEKGETIVECISIDESMPAFHPNLIKMDIEGAELDALLGARRTIERDRPGLAISVYHRPEHLWTIPLLVRPWLKGGTHHVRAHGHTDFDVIYYWIPTD